MNRQMKASDQSRQALSKGAGVSPLVSPAPETPFLDVLRQHQEASEAVRLARQP